MAVALLLAPEWPSTFRRTIHAEDGTPARTIVFEQLQPVVLEDDEFIALADDVGKALRYAAIDADGKPLTKPARDQGDFDDLKPKKRKK